MNTLKLLNLPKTAFTAKEIVSKYMTTGSHNHSPHIYQGKAAKRLKLIKVEFSITLCALSFVTTPCALKQLFFGIARVHKVKL
jgi:hypothetical protein